MFRTTELDCPNCHGPGRAVQRRDWDSGVPVDLGCSDCGYEVTYDTAPTAPTTPTADTPTTTDETSDAPASESGGFPQHQGGPWYLLSNESKVRGRAAALRAQAALSGG